MVQLEEAYARATVAITRARSLCLIMGPLDMKGLLGAATVMGTLMYGAGHVWEGQAHFYLHDGELSRAPPDETFIHMLRQNCSLTGPHFPPPAIVEALQDYVTHYYKVRRLHLIVVDLWRPWKYNTARAKAITDQLWYISHCDATHRVSPLRPDGPEPPLRCRRFAYGYALDGSECPSYLVWPQRDGHSYVVLDTSTNDTLPLDQEFFRPLGMEHFYDSFALESQISVRREALRLFGLREDELMPDLHITRDGVLRIRLGAHQEHARSSVSVGHLFPSAPATDDPFRLPRPNVVLWPNQTPAIYSNPLPPTTLSDTHPPPQGLPSSAAVLYQLGLTEMLSPNILLCPALNPYDWMVAYSALTLPHFCTDHLSVLQNPQVLDAFETKIRQPLLSGQLDAVAAHFIALLPPPPSTFTEQPWILHSKTRKPPASTLPPNDDNIVQDTPSHVAKSPFHLDNIHAAVANLASLLANADDIPKSPKGWIKVAILPTYAGKGVPGNFDSNTQEIVSNGVLTVVSYGIHKPLSENLIAALVAFDNRKRRMRFDIGHFTPGRSQSAQLVICLSPSSVPHPIGGPSRPSGSSPLAHFPLLPNNALPYAIYFCPAQARQVILRDGIRPKRKSSSSTSSAVKVLPSPTPDPFSIVGGHPLRGNTDACIVLDIHKMLTDNISFVVHSADNCYGTDTVPLPTRYFAAAFTFTPFGVQQNWPNPGSSQQVQHSSRPKYVPPTHSVAEAVRSTAADVRLQSTFSRSLPNQPADDDTEMSGPQLKVKLPTPRKLKLLWIVSSTLSIILLSSLMKNIT